MTVHIHIACTGSHSLYRIMVMATSVVGVMKMRNTVPRVGLKSTSLAFRASVLPLHHIGIPDVITIPMPTSLCGSLPQRSVQTTTLAPTPLNCKYFSAYNYIPRDNGLTYKYTG